MEVLFITINYPRSGQESRKHSLRLQPEVNGLLGMVTRSTFGEIIGSGTFSLQQQLMHLSDRDIAGHNAKLSTMVNDNVIVIPQSLMHILDNLGVSPRSPIICNSEDEDYRIWCQDSKGKFSTKSAFESIRRTRPKVSWYKNIWNNFIHPRTAATGWKLLHGCAATDDRIQKSGIPLVSACRLCKSAEENLTHLLWECSFSTQLWTWLAAGFLIQQPLPGFKEAILLSNSWSPMMKQIWNSGVVAAMVSLWNMRNKVYFESKVPNLMNCKQFVRAQIVCTHHRSKACNGNNNWERLVLTNWAVTPRPKQAPQLKTCVWIPPEPNIMKLNIDGAVFGSPGPSGIGICSRFEGEFIFTFAKD
ncbi:hypothetical protein IFM89_005161 [Coptis chinensis]|uniref:Reverse transcriptase zinc-binding domain-containing protein n=1 Tax=Coptis chinensis TaxID=261450 RepID=A0A835M7D5_9MAGN|nr:hypothetical protein IFM89_005161 [Coptis chinensis]